MLYIAFLRGINVGGHTVKMERLRELFAALGFSAVRTYIQSGNVFFERAQADRQALTEMIERHLREALGYEVPVFLRSVEELESIVARDPFKELTVTDDMRLCVTFLSEPAPTDITLPLRSSKGDIELIYATDYEAYIVWRIIDGRPPATNNIVEKTLGKRTTTRFFPTTVKILAAAKQA